MLFRSRGGKGKKIGWVRLPTLQVKVEQGSDGRGANGQLGARLGDERTRRERVRRSGDEVRPAEQQSQIVWGDLRLELEYEERLARFAMIGPYSASSSRLSNLSQVSRMKIRNRKIWHSSE